MAKPSKQPRLTAAAWRALADLTLCATAIGRAKDGDCICRLMPRMRRSRDRLDGALAAARRAYSTFEFSGHPADIAAHEADIDATNAAQALADAVVDAAERREGARATVVTAAANLAAAMGKVERTLRRVRKALAAEKPPAGRS